MNYEELTKRAYENAKAHGFHEEEYDIRHFLMLAVTEIAEMVEADRKLRRAKKYIYSHSSMSGNVAFEMFIKDSVEDEMADFCIRLFDLSGLMGWKLGELCDKEKEEAESDFKNKIAMKPFTVKAHILTSLITGPFVGVHDVELALYFVRQWAKQEDIDLEWHILKKMAYNESRPKMHGKKY